MKSTFNYFFVGFLLLFGLSAVQAEVTITYYHTDALGSVIGSSDDAGNLLWTESYYPHGAPRENSVASQSDDIRYTGKPYDSVMGLSYYGGRYYNPEIGRFMSMDPVSALDTVSSNPQLFNRYVYANNNPYKFVDPGGDLPILVPLYFAYKGLSVAADVTDVALNLSQGNIIGAAATIAGALDPTGLTNKLKKINKVAKRATQNGIGVTRHSVQQKINRQVKSADELDAIKNPLDVRPVKLDELGRPSQRSIGRKAEVARNPETGDIVSVNPTSTKKAERLLHRQRGQ